MKKLLAVLVVSITFAISTSAHGFFLIYKVSASIKGVDSISGLPVSIPLKGCLLLNYTIDPNTNNYDMEDSVFIMYGNDVTKRKVYVELDNNGNGLLDLGWWQQGPLYNFFSVSSYSPFGFDSVIYGKVKPTYVGGGHTILDCAPSLKGVFWAKGGMLLEQSRDIAGSGNMSASLDVSDTKMANDDPGRWTQDALIAAIKANGLVGYIDVTPN